MFGRSASLEHIRFLWIRVAKTRVEDAFCHALVESIYGLSC